MLNNIPLKLAALWSSLVFSVTAQATVLTFDIANQAQSRQIPGTYGNRVSGPVMGSFSYGVGGGFTPNVTVRYLNDAPRFWGTGYSDLENVVYAETVNAQDDLTIVLSADEGFQVRLESFDVGNFTNTRGTIDEIRIEDGSGRVLFEQQDVEVPGSNDSRLTFVPRVGATAPQVRLIIRGAFNSIGFDNIRFSQVAQPVATEGSVLTFDVEDVPRSFGREIPQAYGDNITAAITDRVAYGFMGTSTPQVGVSYTSNRPTVNPVLFGVAGYNNLSNVIYSQAPQFTCILKAEGGRTVSLVGFDVGSFVESGPIVTQVSLRGVRVEDGNGQVLFTRSNLTLPGRTGVHEHFDFPARLTAPELRITLDAGNDTELYGMFALDNIHFIQGEVPPPEAELSLEARPAGLNQIELRWPVVAAGLILESSGTMLMDTWMETPTPGLVVNAGMASVVLPTNQGRRFFRLRRP